MTSLFEDIKIGLEQAIEYEKGNLKANTVKLKMKPLTDFSAKEVREIRIRTNLSQASFAKLFGVSKKTVEAWEAGRNIPNGTAKRFLELLHEDPNFPKKVGIITEEPKQDSVR
jgi:putative transcriptional regulator